MKKKLFAEMTGKQKPTKKWLFFPVSFIFHTIIIAAMVLTPLLTADAQLPPIKTISIKMVAPHTLSLPVGRSGPARTQGRLREDRAGSARKPTAPVQSNALVEPVKIPDVIEEEPFIDFTPGFVEGGNFVEGALEGGGDVPGALPGDRTNDSGPIRNLRVEQIPKLIRKVTPVYPDIAIRSRTQGKVIIEAETNIYGRVTRTKVISGNPLLVPAALEAVKKWVYEPYIINGFPKPVRFTVTLEFTLKHQ